MSAPAGKPVSVTAWSELAARKSEVRKIPASARALRVLVGGQHDGARRLGARAWSAVFWSAKADRAAARTAGAR